MSRQFIAMKQDIENPRNRQLSRLSLPSQSISPKSKSPEKKKMISNQSQSSEEEYDSSDDSQANNEEVKEMIKKNINYTIKNEELPPIQSPMYSQISSNFQLRRNSPLLQLRKRFMSNHGKDNLNLYLNNNHFFQEMRMKLDENTYQQLSSEIQIKQFRHFDIIFEYGDVGDSFYIILEGEVFVLGPVNQKIADKINEKIKKKREDEQLQKKQKEELIKNMPKHRKQIFSDVQEVNQLQSQQQPEQQLKEQLSPLKEQQRRNEEYNKIIQEKKRQLKVLEQEQLLIKSANVDVDMPLLNTQALEKSLAQIKQQENIQPVGQQQSSSSNLNNSGSLYNQLASGQILSPNLLSVNQTPETYKSIFQHSKENNSDRRQSNISRHSYSPITVNNDDDKNNSSNNPNNSSSNFCPNSNKIHQTRKTPMPTRVTEKISTQKQLKMQILKNVLSKQLNSQAIQAPTQTPELPANEDTLSVFTQQLQSPQVILTPVQIIQQQTAKPQLRRGATMMMPLLKSIGKKQQIVQEKKEPTPQYKLQPQEEEFAINHVTECYPDFKIIRTLIKGESFGELALRLNQDRTASIVCKTDCKLAILTKDAYNRILDNHYKIQLNEKINYFKNVPGFKEVAFETIAGIVMHLKKRLYTMGQIIYQEDQVDNKLYFVISGQIQLSKSAPIDPYSINNKSPQTNQEKLQEINKIMFSKANKMKQQQQLDQGGFQGESNENPSANSNANQLQQDSKGQKANQKKYDPRQPRILMATKGQYQYFGEVEVMQNIPRFTRAECASPHAEVFRISKKKFFNNLGSFRILQLLQTGSQNLEKWREQLYKQISNKVLFQRDPLQETFHNIGQAQKLIQEKFKKDFIKNSNNLLYQNKSKNETENTAKSIYFQQVRIYMNKLSDVSNAIKSIKKIENNDIEIIRGQTKNIVQNGRLKSRSQFNSPNQNQSQSQRANNTTLASLLVSQQNRSTINKQKKYSIIFDQATSLTQRGVVSIDNSMNSQFLNRNRSEPNILINQEPIKKSSLNYQQILYNEENINQNLMNGENNEAIIVDQSVAGRLQQQQKKKIRQAESVSDLNDNNSNYEYQNRYNIISQKLSGQAQSETNSAYDQLNMISQRSNQVSISLAPQNLSLARINLSSPLSERMKSERQINMTCLEPLHNKKKSSSIAGKIEPVDMNSIYKLIFSGKVTPVLKQKEKLDPDIMKRKLFMRGRQNSITNLHRYIYSDELSRTEESKQQLLISQIKRKNVCRHLKLEKILSYKYLDDPKIQVSDIIPAKQMKISKSINNLKQQQKLTIFNQIQDEKQLKKQKSEEKVQTDHHDIERQEQNSDQQSDSSQQQQQSIHQMQQTGKIEPYDHQIQ